MPSMPCIATSSCSQSIIGNLALTYGDRPFGEKYSEEKQQELIKKLDELESEYSINRIDFLEWQEKGREIINEFFLA